LHDRFLHKPDKNRGIKMTQYDFHVHYTLATPISGGDRDGWDFSCESCSYHARYILGDDKTQYLLEILNVGDPFARHIGPNTADPFLDPCGDTIQPDEVYFEPEENEPVEDLFIEHTWLTPELRRKLSLILDQLDN
jgi:hypothetical protein